MAKCEHCDSANVPGALYCDKCGHSLPTLLAWPPGSSMLAPEEPAEPVPMSEDEITVELEAPQEPEPSKFDDEQPESQPHLRLQLTSGMIIDLGNRERIIIGRKDRGKKPEVDLAPYGGIEQGVSRQHAVITFDNGCYYIEDLNSVNETLLNTCRLFPGQPYPLKHEDQLQFGMLVVTVLLRQTLH
jgi:hypothetical protein